MNEESFRAVVGELLLSQEGISVTALARENRCWGRSPQVLRAIRRPIWMLITLFAPVALIVPQVWEKCCWRVDCQ